MSIQMKQGLAIKLIETRSLEEGCLAGVSFRGGTACSNFALFADGQDDAAWDGEGGDNAMMFEANRAFWHVFKAYVTKLDSALAGADIFLDAAATMIAWNLDDVSSVPLLLGELFSASPEQGLFDVAKEEAFSEYAAKFSNPLFRFTHKILEQTEPAFGFSYEAFTQDFENITFEEFQSAWSTLVVPGNATLCVMSADTDKAQVVIDSLDAPASEGEVIAVPTAPAVPLDRHMNIELFGTSLFDLGALCFGQMPAFSPMEKKVFLEVVNQHLFGGVGSVSVDAFDASIIFTDRVEEDLLDPQMWQLDADAFARCATDLAARMAGIFQRFPMLFVAEQARDLQQGINDVAVMQVAPRIPFDAFAEKLADAFEDARQIRISQVCASDEMLAA